MSTIVDIVNDKIPILDDAVYFIPKGVNNISDYKKFIQHSKSINEISNTSSSLVLDSEIKVETGKEESEDGLYMEEKELLIETSILNDFISIEDIQIETSENKYEDKHLSIKVENVNLLSGVETTDEEEKIELISCEDLTQNMKLKEILFEEKEEKEEKRENEKKEKVENAKEEKEEDESDSGLSSLFDSSDLSDISKLMEEDEEKDEKGSLDADIEFINKQKLESLKDEEDDEFKDLVSKINSINDTDDEDDMIGMLSKITLKDFENEEDFI